MSISNCNEEVGSIFDRVKNRFKAAEPPKPLTAGIIPYNIQSPRGNMVLYDLAGQPESYTSHCACIEATSLSSPAVFLSLVDVSLSQKEINKQLNYWSTMISSVCSECPSEVIVVGTHVDKVNKEGLLRRTKDIEDLAKAIFKNQHFRGFIPLDATARFSDNMKRFIGVLRESHDTVVQQCPVISTDCHMLYAFLQQMVPSQQVVTISYLMSQLQADKTNVLPTDTSEIIPLLSTLSSKGLILFISNKHNLDESWIVVQKSMLLERVAGVLFAPKGLFGEYRALASNIGLVPIPRITEHFPDLNVHMLVEFLSQLKLCHLVDSALNIVDVSQTSLDLTRDSAGSGYSLFVPALINEARPDSFDPNFNTKGSFGWLMHTKEEHQFFHNRFLHVLMLALMSRCSNADILCNPELRSFNRQCLVWSTGICWNSDEGGMTILVDVVEQFRSLYVAVSFPGSQYQELTVIQEIRKIFNQFCRSVDVAEFVIDPRQVNSLFNKGVMPRSLSCMEMSKLKKDIMNNKDFVYDLNGKVVSIAEWIRAERRLPKLIGIDHVMGVESIPDVIGPKLEDLMNEIGAVIPAKWRALGVQLRIPDGVLDGIQSENAGMPEPDQKSFEKVFIKWRQQGSETTYTWSHIIGILRTPAVGENALAETLATKFNEI